jgi:hypothetical protein
MSRLNCHHPSSTYSHNILYHLYLAGVNVCDDVLVLARPYFIITIVIKKRYKGRAIVFASVSFVCRHRHSVSIEGLIQT